MNELGELKARAAARRGHEHDVSNAMHLWDCLEEERADLDRAIALAEEQIERSNKAVTLAGQNLVGFIRSENERNEARALAKQLAEGLRREGRIVNGLLYREGDAALTAYEEQSKGWI